MIQYRGTLWLQRGSPSMPKPVMARFLQIHFRGLTALK
jgi:hypothetical protein